MDAFLEKNEETGIEVERIVEESRKKVTEEKEKDEEYDERSNTVDMEVVMKAKRSKVPKIVSSSGPYSLKNQFCPLLSIHSLQMND